MALNGYSLSLLNLISKRPFALNLHRLRTNFFGICIGNEIDKSLDILLKINFISIDIEDIATITKEGAVFLASYDKYEADKIAKGYFRFTLLKFLYELEGKIYIYALPRIFKKNVQKSASSRTNFHLLYYLDFDNEMMHFVNKSGNNWYHLNEAEKKKYEYYLRKENENVRDEVKEPDILEIKKDVKPQSILNVPKYLSAERLQDLKLLRPQKKVHPEITRYNEIKEIGMWLIKYMREISIVIIGGLVLAYIVFHFHLFQAK